jgi:hypothetical protein
MLRKLSVLQKLLRQFRADYDSGSALSAQLLTTVI